MIRKIIYIFLSVALIVSCKSSGNKPDGELDMPVPGESQPLEISSETMEQMVENVSSPIEMAALIKSIGVPFSKKYMANTEYADNYISSSRKAFSLGVYGADLGYLNMYNQTTSILNYISAIKSLADGVNVGQFFDFPTLKRLATNNENIDSLMYISVHSFNQMDKYLRENKRGNLSALMIAGVWIEGFYLATQVAMDTGNEQVAESIGDQKKILNQLLLILKNYESQDAYIKTLIEELNKIKEAFKEVEITIEVGEPEAVEENGMLVIIQHEKSIVHMSEDVLNDIIIKAEKVRNKLISV